MLTKIICCGIELLYNGGLDELCWDVTEVLFGGGAIGLPVTIARCGGIELLFNGGLDKLGLYVSGVLGCGALGLLATIVC